MGVRTRFIAVVAMISVPLLAADALSGIAQYRAQVTDLASQAARLANTLEQSRAGYAETVLAVLRQARTAPEIRGGDSQQCQRYLAQLSDNTALFSNAVKVGMDGRPLCWARPPEQPSTEPSAERSGALGPAAREVFSRVIAEHDFVAGDSGHTLRGTGFQPFGLPVTNDHGEMTAVLIVGLRVDFLAGRAARLGMSPWSTVIILDRAGEPLAQFPSARFAKAELAPLVGKGFQGQLTTADGVGFLTYALPYRDGLQIAVAVDRQQALAGTIQALLEALLPRLAIVLVASGLGGVVGLRLLRKLDEKNAELVLAGSVLANAAEAYAITDDAGRVVSINPAFSDITGFAEADAQGAELRDLLAAKEDQARFDEIWRELRVAGKWQGELSNLRKDGESFLAWQTMTVVRALDATRIICLFSDITDLRRKEEHIRHQAFHDGLTGLPNRLLLQDRLAHSIELSRRQGDQLAVMFLDLDRFKVVNDSLGHDVGDAILIEVAARLGRCLRRSDSIARIGGDEFVVLQPDVIHPNEAVEVAEKIIAAIAPPIEAEGQEIRIGVSIGIAMFPVDGEEVGTLMKNADTALFEAKAAGRNTFRFFLQSMNAEARDRLEMEAALRHALDRSEFELLYQPKVCLQTLALEGVEALIRWRRPEHGLVSPLQFIPLAEETGLISRIGDWVLEEACRQIAQWQAMGRDIKVAINVSARQFQDPKFSDRVAETIASRAIPPSLLEIEVTESMVMTAPEQAIGQLTRLRAMGLEVAVDDFGTGYSSLSYLKRLPLTCIKIDRAFVKGIDGDRENAAIVAAIIAVGKALGAGIVAEGAETLAEADHLRRAGCPTAQGYLYSRPVPAAEIPGWVAPPHTLPETVAET